MADGIYIIVGHDSYYSVMSIRGKHEVFLICPMGVTRRSPINTLDMLVDFLCEFTVQPISQTQLTAPYQQLTDEQ